MSEHAAELARRVLGGDRSAIGQAITLVESRAPHHREAAASLLTALMPRSGLALRVGLTGVPGAGKSTLIEALGVKLIGRGRRVGVLAVDPSSARTGGSILGDKSRMPRLAVDELAFVRPSPSSGTLGGVASRTRECMVVLEAAGFDVIIVETVGVGQSETMVAGMTDVFVAVMIPNAGDELQGIKRGLLELVDVVAVNKADGGNEEAAQLAANGLRTALRLVRGHDEATGARVLTCSARTALGIDELWNDVEARAAALRASGELERRRSAQAVEWLRALVREHAMSMVQDFERATAVVQAAEADVAQGRSTPRAAADRVVAGFRAWLTEGGLLGRGEGRPID